MADRFRALRGVAGENGGPMEEIWLAVRQHADTVRFEQARDCGLLREIVDVDTLAHIQQLDANRALIVGVIDSAGVVEIHTEGVGQITQPDVSGIGLSIMLESHATFLSS